jgi:hypothetical protein
MRRSGTDGTFPIFGSESPAHHASKLDALWLGSLRTHRTPVLLRAEASQGALAVGGECELAGVAPLRNVMRRIHDYDTCQSRHKQTIRKRPVCPRFPPPVSNFQLERTSAGLSTIKRKSRPTAAAPPRSRCSDLYDSIHFVYKFCFLLAARESQFFFLTV